MVFVQMDRFKLVMIFCKFRVESCLGKKWIELAQDMDMWRALANAVMNLRVP